MLRTSIPMDVWLRQPDGCIETAVRMLLDEQDEIDRADTNDPPAAGWSG